MSSGTFKLACLFVIASILTWLIPATGSAQEEKLDERYAARGVAMGAGVTGTLLITINRYSTDEERAALIESLKTNGQQKTVDLLRKQSDKGFARTSTGSGMRGQPSVRLRYARQYKTPEGKRLVVVLTDRNMSLREAASMGRSTEYDISALVMEMEPAEGDDKLVEKGTGVYYAAAKMEFDEDGKLNVEYLGTQPVRLTDIRREK